MDKILILRKKENKGVLATSNSRGVLLSGACVNLRARGERPTLLTERAVL
jgi:hypothetical protein